MAVKSAKKPTVKAHLKSTKTSKLSPSSGKNKPTKISVDIKTISPTIKKPATPLHIAIAGNIGSGKTTLTNLLAKNMKWEPHFEAVDDNPYLNDFYEDMQRWS